LSRSGDGSQADGRRGDATSGDLSTPGPKPTIKSSKQSFSFISPPLSIFAYSTPSGHPIHEDAAI